jgi:hypothetical protein
MFVREASTVLVRVTSSALPFNEWTSKRGCNQGGRTRDWEIRTWSASRSSSASPRATRNAKTKTLRSAQSYARPTKLGGIAGGTLQRALPKSFGPRAPRASCQRAFPGAEISGNTRRDSVVSAPPARLSHPTPRRRPGFLSLNPFPTPPVSARSAATRIHNQGTRRSLG